ncbi:hypothetical protein [Neomegalonema sp.]|uniref:hypothetical protein n=1 Tax=Neomegalonema sp. TaxID=2039713 RepID=UPI0026123531|nr:hypothetical protein [Neomegalonema sp.]MDD2869710.1 hypothetical protein [Neomegalonema sp.]
MTDPVDHEAESLQILRERALNLQGSADPLYRVIHRQRTSEVFRVTREELEDIRDGGNSGSFWEQVGVGVMITGVGLLLDALTSPPYGSGRIAFIFCFVFTGALAYFWGHSARGKSNKIISRILGPHDRKS